MRWSAASWPDASDHTICEFAGGSDKHRLLAGKPLRFRCAGDGYPSSGGNNVNSIDDGGGTKAVTMMAPNAITAVQDAYVKKVIDTLNDLPN